MKALGRAAGVGRTPERRSAERVSPYRGGRWMDQALAVSGLTPEPGTLRTQLLSFRLVALTSGSLREEVQSPRHAIQVPYLPPRREGLLAEGTRGRRIPSFERGRSQGAERQPDGTQVSCLPGVIKLCFPVLCCFTRLPLRPQQISKPAMGPGNPREVTDLVEQLQPLMDPPNTLVRPSLAKLRMA